MFNLLKNLAYIIVVVSAGYGLFYVCLSSRMRRDLAFKPLAIFAGLAAVGFLSPNLLVVHAAALLLVPIVARKRSEIAPVYLVAVLAVPALEVSPAFGDIPLFPYSVLETLALGSLAAYLLSPKLAGKRSIAADLPFIAVIAMLLFSTARETGPTNVIREMTFYALSLGVPYFVITRCCRSVEDLRKALVWFSAGSVMLATLLIYERLTGWPLYNLMLHRYDLLSDGMVIAMRLGSLRSVGPIGNAMIAGFVLVFGLAAVLSSARAFSDKKWPLLLAAVIGVGLLGPQSRGALLGAGIVVLATSLYRVRRGQIVEVGLAGLVAAAVGAFTLWRGAGNQELEGTLDYRERLLQRGLEEFWRYPLAGDTLANVKARLVDMTQGEGIVDFVNTYLYFMLTTGALGAIIFTVAILVPVAQLWLARGALRKIPYAPDVAAMCFASLCASLVMLSFTSLQSRAALLTILALGITSNTVALTRMRRRSAVGVMAAEAPQVRPA